MKIGRFQFGKNDPPRAGFYFDRPLVAIQSDDWGRVGVCDRAGYEQLRAAGVALGQNPYDFYTLETAEDVIALQDLLSRHHDSTGRAACMVMNFVLANLDFARTLGGSGGQTHLLPLSKGLPAGWRRPGLMEAYKQGIAQEVFYPALHGLTHFCRGALERALSDAGERAATLKTFWNANTPYIYWRMPWVGYEYYDPERSELLPAAQQDAVIRHGVEEFAKFFSAFPHSACAPGYRANSDTHNAWSHWGIRVVQNGSGAPRSPHLDDQQILNLYRTIDFEPSQRELPIEKYVELAGNCFRRGLPAIISVHSINFHSSLRNFRDSTLTDLDQLLSALEAKFPDLLYVHDEDIYKLVIKGKFEATHGTVSVNVTGGAAALTGGGQR